MSAEYIVEYVGGTFRKWRVSPLCEPDRYYRNLHKALRVMCKKLNMNYPLIKIDENALIEKYSEIRIYYDKERKPSPFGSGEDIGDRYNSILPDYINHYENGAWLIQACPRGKTFWRSGKDYNDKTLNRALLALARGLIMRSNNEPTR